MEIDINFKPRDVEEKGLKYYYAGIKDYIKSNQSAIEYIESNHDYEWETWEQWFYEQGILDYERFLKER